jgi:hypothetical protein
VIHLTPKADFEIFLKVADTSDLHDLISTGSFEWAQAIVVLRSKNIEGLIGD